MSRPATGHVDVDAVRRMHPIDDVVAASGVDLVPRGNGFVGCCPFHPDHTPSMSVNGIPDRFHCFGCGASGDVIDFVQRRYGLGFREAVDRLEGPDLGAVGSARRPVARPQAAPTVSRERAYEINAMAWELFADPVGARFARAYLHHHRGIDVAPLEEIAGGPLAGRAGSGWTHLTHHLGSQGVTHDELLAVDLAQTTRHGRVIDTLRNRIILPVRVRGGRISGFIGRDLTGDPRAPKYRNPTHTPVFDKALTLYRPALTPPGPEATMVVVEGPMDALALDAAAATAELADQLIAVSANGTAIAAAQAAHVCALAPGDIVLALDSDAAGRAGTERWLHALVLERRRVVRLADLPDRIDPADWLAQHGAAGLGAFGGGPADQSCTPPRMPGRELARICLSRARDPIRGTANQLLAIARLTPGHGAAELLGQAEQEMTRLGWNPRGAFGNYLRTQAAQDLRDRPPTVGRNPTTLAPARALHR